MRQRTKRRVVPRKMTSIYEIEDLKIYIFCQYDWSVNRRIIGQRELPDMIRHNIPTTTLHLLYTLTLQKAVLVHNMALLADTTVLVSGASGYIGAHVVKTLLDRGYSVRGTVRSTSNKNKIGYLQVSSVATCVAPFVYSLSSSYWYTSFSSCLALAI